MLNLKMNTDAAETAFMLIERLSGWHVEVEGQPGVWEINGTFQNKLALIPVDEDGQALGGEHYFEFPVTLTVL